jgi:hypothetical protein
MSTNTSSHHWLTLLITVVLVIIEGYVLTAGQTHG